MAYSIDLRKKAMAFLDSGNTWRATAKTFGISLSTISDWRKKRIKTGDLKDAPLKRVPRILDPKRLFDYVQANPDAYQSEVARAFGCSAQAVQKAFKRLGITRKKRPGDSKSKDRSWFWSI